jgi:hypothetical protein
MFPLSHLARRDNRERLGWPPQTTAPHHHSCRDDERAQIRENARRLAGSRAPGRGRIGCDGGSGAAGGDGGSGASPAAHIARRTEHPLGVVGSSARPLLKAARTVAGQLARHPRPHGDCRALLMTAVGVPRLPAFPLALGLLLRSSASALAATGSMRHVSHLPSVSVLEHSHPAFP